VDIALTSALTCLFAILVVAVSNSVLQVPLTLRHLSSPIISLKNRFKEQKGREKKYINKRRRKAQSSKQLPQESQTGR
jgi:hypothetical protein